MRILITGVAGFIGSNLTFSLLDRGYDVVGIDNFSQGFRRNMSLFLNHKNFQFIEGDVRNYSLLGRLVRDSEIVVHLAAFKIPRYGNSYDTLEINSVGTRNVLKAALNNHCRVIIASTSDVYGANPELPFHEKSDLWVGPSSVPRWAYAVSKIYDEHLAYAYQDAFDLPVVIVRLFGGYGPNQNTSWWGGPQSVFIGAAIRNEEMEIHGDGKQTRSFTFIDDHVDGLIRCIEREEAIGHVFNLGATEEITIIDLAFLIWNLVRAERPKYKLVSYSTFGKYQDVRRRVPCISKAERLLGFNPRTDLKTGLIKTIEWQRNTFNDRNSDGK